MTPQSSTFADLLRMSATGPDVFESEEYAGGEVPRLFGGHLLAQGLWVAGQSVGPALEVASLRGLFLRGVDPWTRVGYRASTVKAGRSLRHRRVVATQGGREVFTLEATFVVRAESNGASPVPPADASGIATPEQAHPDPAHAGAPLASFAYTDCFELRFVHEPQADASRPQPFHPVWVRAGRLGEGLDGDSLAHACALAFVSDMGSLSSAMPRTEGRDPFEGSSVEHSIWFGSRSDLSGWHLIDLAPALQHGRLGLAHGSIRDESHRQVAVVSQLAFF